MSNQDPTPNPGTKPKQAVVLIHGVGEQVPMETLRGFVEAVWTTDPNLRYRNKPSTAWSKPDHVSGNYELRRLTTVEDLDGRRTDFFEFYWAHLMTGTTFSHLRAWLGVLLFRPPGSVPRQLGFVWGVVVLTLIAATVFLVLKAAGLLPGVGLEVGTDTVILTALGAAAGGLLIRFAHNALGTLMIDVAGDAARYLHVAPANIEIRRRIREAGIHLLQKLHEGGEYDRIVVVGHSLGSVIGYDILTHYWVRHRHPRFPLDVPPGEYSSRELLEDRIRCAGDGQLDIDDFQELQSAYHNEIRLQGCDWLVTDFITLGSPLAHGPYLLERSEAGFRQRIESREFPTCPPVLEKVGGELRFTFDAGKDDEKVARPHHAAVFAPTRWTNLYFPCRATCWGDLIGGPLAPHFGQGIRDVAVTTPVRGNFFSHTLYWDLGDKAPSTPDSDAAYMVPECIEALRRAVRLRM